MIEVRPVAAADRAWVVELLSRRWGSTQLVSRGRVHCGTDLAGFVALNDGDPAGLATYAIHGAQCELISLDSEVEEVGIGSALVSAVADGARQAGCHRLWLITTNDNLHALGFYQRRGFEIEAVHRNAIAESRMLKPSIPMIGLDGVPLRDEIELAMKL